MENTWLKRLLALAGLALFLAVLVLVPIALYADTLYRGVFDADQRGAQVQETALTSFDLFAEETEHQTKSRIAGWLSAVASQEVAVSSPRGRLAATQYEPVGGEENATWAILFHGGPGTDRAQVLDIACMLSLRGYRVLTPDLYAHGASEGDAPTLGFGDAQDVLAWIDYVEKTKPGARIVLFGQDEGAAAVLLAACASSRLRRIARATTGLRACSRLQVCGSIACKLRCSGSCLSSERAGMRKSFLRALLRRMCRCCSSTARAIRLFPRGTARISHWRLAKMRSCVISRARATGFPASSMSRFS